MTSAPDEDKVGVPYARRMSQEISVWYMDCLFSILADSQGTSGRFGVMELLAPFGPPGPAHQGAVRPARY
jgi:hypothetical protein